MQIPLTRIQKLIGERMSQSRRTMPCFYIASRADITELMAIRPKLRKSLGVKVTTNAFYIRALALAVRQFPLMAGKLSGDNIKIAERVNVGFAVNAPQGLIVPVVKDADKKMLADIAREEKLLTDLARDNQLTLTDMEGETVALSNLGIYGIDSFIGIVPPPASAILAVGNVDPVVVRKGSEFLARKILSMSLAVDNRVINEPYAARFLGFIKEQLQNPQQLA
jgi:pyruvate dehydrogenase E2 component (dihydrolipoamide acetyltransferase)